MKLNKIFAATTAITLAAIAIPASAAVSISTDKASFDKLHNGVASYAFPFTSDKDLGSSYTVDAVTFKSKDMWGLNDCYTYGQSVLADISGDFAVSYKGATLALDLVSTKDETLAYTVNGLSSKLNLKAYTPTFIGFDAGGPNIGINVLFDATCSSSINVLGFQTAVPEAATWAMMMVGLGVVGGSLRRRRSVTTSVRFA